MRAAAEIEELARLVDGNLFIGLGELLDEVALHEVAFALELLQAFIARQKFARVRDVLLHQFLHLLLDLLQVFRRERRGAIEIVKESGVGRRPVAQLGLGKQFEHGRRQQMRGRMPVNFKRLGIAIGQQAKVGIFFQRLGDVDEIAVGFGDESGISQTLANGFSDIERGRPFRDFFHTSVRKLDMDAVCHKLGSKWNVFSLLEGAGWVKRIVGMTCGGVLSAGKAARQ